VFVEIEGSEHGIEEMTRALGLTPSDYILDSYRALYLQHRDAHGLSGHDMLFDPPAA
jgi:hypothetical protein